jgi:lipoprotein NlpI
MAQSDDDNESEAQGALAQVERLSAAGEREKVIELCTALMERLPTEPMLYYERAQAQKVLGRHRAALDDINKAVERQPKGILFVFFRGLWSLEVGDCATAVLDFTTVIELENVSDPSGFCDSAQLARALAYIFLGQFDLAQRDLDNRESVDESVDDMWARGRTWTAAQMRQLVAKRRRPV